MKIKVTASRRDDILRRKAEYEEQQNARNARIDEQKGRYDTALHNVFSGVESAIRQELGDNVGELEIRVDTRYGEGLEVKIGNDRGGPRRSANAALTWSWSAYIDKQGEVHKESSSWSGLEAVTMDQIADLKQTVRQLEIINSMDWSTLLNQTVPQYSDYISDDLSYGRNNRPNFEQELLEADLEEAIGANILVKAKQGRDYRGEVYFQILRDSGTQYTVKEAPANYVERLMRGETLPYSGNDITSVKDLMDKWAASFRVRKNNFMNWIYQPLQTQPF